MAVADVLKLIQENDVKFVDLRFTDTRGKEQHVSMPAHVVTDDEVWFERGHAFDGSSIAGWKGIQASDMLLMADPTTARIDPFFDEATLFMTCDVVEPADGKGYDRYPRSIAKRAEAYLKAPASATPPTSVRNLNSSFSTRLPGTRTCPAATSRSKQKKPHGRPPRNSKAATWATARASRAAISRFPRSTPRRTSVRPCVCCWKSWASGRSAPP